MIFEITYISGDYYDENLKKRVDKTKVYKQVGENIEEAVLNFTKNMNKKIVSIKESNENTLGNIFPQLGEILKKYENEK